MRAYASAATLACFILAGSLQAQPPAAPRAAGPKPNMSTDPLLRGFEFRSIGPAVMMGRVDDIQGSEKDPMLLYVGFATGGLWKSTDGGNHWKSQFDNMAERIHRRHRHRAFGSECGLRRHGRSQQPPELVHRRRRVGHHRRRQDLEPSRPGRHAVHRPHRGRPDQSEDRVRRGDGPPVRTESRSAACTSRPTAARPGRSPSTSIPIPGFNDVAIDPSNPKILYASSFQRRRTWWGYNGGGPGSALWKSTDGGDTWTKLEGPGWPKPKDGIYGRIAISIFRAQAQHHLRAGGSGRERRHRRRHHRGRRPGASGGRGGAAWRIRRTSRRSGGGHSRSGGCGGGGGGGGGGRGSALARRIRMAAACSAPTMAARPGPS